MRMMIFTFLNGHTNEDGEDEDGESELNIGKKLDFDIIEQKVDLTYLTHLYLKVDCNEHRDNFCNCYETFSRNLKNFRNATMGCQI